MIAVALGMIAAQAVLMPGTAAQVDSAASAPAPRGPEQPVPFSHKLHAGALSLSCDTCHAPSSSGETLAIPQAELCMQCHQTIATGRPGVQKLTSFATAGQKIPWVRVYELPSFVHFSHKMHTDHSNTCKECHGPVEEREQLARETDISMAGCMNCHRAKQAATGCDACHTLEDGRLHRFWLEAPSSRGAHVDQTAMLREFPKGQFWKLPLLF